MPRAARKWGQIHMGVPGTRPISPRSADDGICDRAWRAPACIQCRETIAVQPCRSSLLWLHHSSSLDDFAACRTYPSSPPQLDDTNTKRNTIGETNIRPESEKKCAMMTGRQYEAAYAQSLRDPDSIGGQQDGAAGLGQALPKVKKFLGS